MLGVYHMDKVAAILFTILYIAETVFLFFLGDSSKHIPSLLIAFAIAVVLIWIGDYLAKKHMRHPVLAVIIIGILITLLMPLALNY